MARLLFIALLLFAGTARAEPWQVSILVYHRFDPAVSPGPTTVTTPTAARQLARIAERGIPVVRLADVAAGTVIGRAVAITADDGHRSVHTELFPLLKRFNFPATLFLNPPGLGRGAYLRPAEIDEMVASGLVTIAAHTMHHPNLTEEAARLGPPGYAALLEREIAPSRAALRQWGDITLLAWPFGQHDRTAERYAANAGFTAAFALEGRAAGPADPPFALPRYQIYEADRGARLDAVLDGLPRRR